jgi:K(+)-stimulated pyrophosphate-energized sodium pump
MSAKKRAVQVAEHTLGRNSRWSFLMESLVYTVPVAGLIALAFAYMKAQWVSEQDAGTEEMQEISRRIKEGAMAFLSAEYKAISMFVAVVAILLAVANSSGEQQSPLIAVAFLVGAVLSALAGYIGMKVATDANVRTTAAARIGLPEALQVAFSGGAVMGMGVVGLSSQRWLGSIPGPH